MMTFSDIWGHLTAGKFKLLWRDLQFWVYRLRHGFDDSDLWDLDTHLSDLILPRLRRFREMNRMGVPGRFCNPDNEHVDDLIVAEEKWNKELDKMIAAFELIAERDFGTPEEEKKIEEGLESFKTNFRALWD